MPAPSLDPQPRLPLVGPAPALADKGSGGLLGRDSPWPAGQRASAKDPPTSGNKPPKTVPRPPTKNTSRDATFHAGASLYGVADAELLAKSTHKFESRSKP